VAPNPVIWSDPDENASKVLLGIVFSIPCGLLERHGFAHSGRRGSCGCSSRVEATEAVDTQPVSKGNPSKPKPPPQPVVSGEACAERLILVAAKKNVAQKYGNSPESGGYCATGVRTSLELSKVGGVAGSLGNAVDFLRSLPPHGFVDNKGRDPNKAPPGSVLVFSGLDTPAYLNNGHYGSPAGNWLGHVTIKGDDGRYYTDGRTAEPALGWTNGINVQKIRNMAGIFVPNPSLSNQYDGKCANIVTDEQVADLALDTAEVSALPFEDPTIRESGQRLVQEGLNTLARGDSSSVFAQALALAREGSGFDQEGQLTNALADRLSSDPSLMAEVDQFTSSRPVEHGLEACKTKVLVATLARDLCLKKAGAKGQDAGDDSSCAKPTSWSVCMVSETLQ
jgi:hypothetical protein